jgi:hypothetical protein
MLTVHLRVNDAATGQPTPVRLRVTGPDGTFLPPLGRAAEFPVGRNELVGGHLRFGRDKFVYIDGTCEIRLPAGVPLAVEILKGPEYAPVREAVTLGPGQMSLRHAVARRLDLRPQGWFAGDTRAHFLTPHDALLEGRAEDLAVVNLLATEYHVPSQDGHMYPSLANLSAFSGQSPALEAGGTLVAVNTFNTHPALGRVGLLHNHRPAYPLTFGGDDATDDWSICDWCDQCHRKNGLTVWADAFELDAQPRPQPLLPWWHRLLDAGFRVPLVGGSGKDSNRLPLGSPRTYAKLPAGEPLTYTGWVNAVRAGRTVVTNGPFVELAVNGAGPGETAQADGPLAIAASAAGVVPFERLEVVANGQVIGTASATPGELCSARLAWNHPLPDGGWVAARVWGPAGESSWTSR